MSTKEKRFGAIFAPCDAVLDYSQWSPAPLFVVSGWHEFDHRLLPGIYK